MQCRVTSYHGFPTQWGIGALANSAMLCYAVLCYPTQYAPYLVGGTCTLRCGDMVCCVIRCYPISCHMFPTLLVTCGLPRCDMLIMLCYAMLHHIIGRHLVGNLYFFCAALSYAIL